MTEIAREIIPVSLEDEMRQSYLDYAMSVIVGRALPDCRDGLKPVHRRVLHAMRELGNDYNKAYKKSARVVGDVIGKYHPHGDSAVYETMVRMAQPFSMRYVLIDGQGNFGSVDGDAPAAMRYTEVRMARIAHELLADIDMDTVDFVPNYDESEREPAVLPARFPNLLVNGASGIAVGMATNIPPHNLTEIINACLAMIDDPAITLAGLMQHVPGPDFPTAGIINGAQEIATAYKTGRGRLSIRARASIEEIDARNGRQAIIVTELPYQVNKARLLERIADLVRNKEIDGISELRDESDKDGMRVVIELKRGEVAEVILNNLYAQTPMETVFGINMVALSEGQPRLLGLRELLDAFLRHRREVVTRRSLFEIRKARDRAHVLEGLAVALANIDEVIALIKASPATPEARSALMARRWPAGAVPQMLARAGAVATRPDGLADEFGLQPGDVYTLSEVQAQAILDMRLHRLTGLEQDKIVAEYRELLARIADLAEILASPARLIAVVRSELVDVREAFGDARRTEISLDHLNLSTEDLIEPQDVVVTLSHAGYAKAQPVSDYQAQRRGGRGKSATAVKDEDFIEKFFIAHTHDTLLCFSNRGKVYWLRVFELPQAGRGSRGKPIVNLLPLQDGEKINALLPIKQFDEDHFVFMATSLGTVKKTPLAAFSRPRASGIIAVDLRDDDRLVGVALTNGRTEIMLCSSGGKAIRFNEEEVRAMGRDATGVRGIKLADDQRVIALLALGEGHILTASENGFGKLTPLDDFPAHSRGGQGVIALQTSERNGQTVAALQVLPANELMLISSTGTLVRTPVNDISVVGRNTQGVRLIRLAEGERLTGIERVEGLDAQDPDTAGDSSGVGTEGGDEAAPA
jgi:DNA gyrase subunit A